MKKTKITVYEFTSGEAKKMSELAFICFSDKTMLDEKQGKLLNRLLAADRKYFEQEIVAIKEILKLRIQDIKTSEAAIVKDLAEIQGKEGNNTSPTSAASVAQHLKDNYVILRSDLINLNFMLIGNSPDNETEEE